MSGRGQVAGVCGHRKGVYDTHPDCLKCSGCTRQRKCRFCDAWTAQDWESVALARTHASRKKSGRSSSWSIASTDPAPVPPPVPAGELTSRAPSISGRSTTSVSSRSRWDIYNMNKQNKISCTNDDLLLQRGRGLPPSPNWGPTPRALGPKLEVPRSPPKARRQASQKGKASEPGAGPAGPSGKGRKSRSKGSVPATVVEHQAALPGATDTEPDTSHQAPGRQVVPHWLHGTSHGTGHQSPGSAAYGDRPSPGTCHHR